MNATTRAHYSRQADEAESMAKEAERQLEALNETANPMNWKIEGLEECIHDAREAAADYRRVIADAS